jgi:rod shape-determining protein MreC
VAVVVRIERDADNSFAKVFCQPSAGVDRGRYVLVLTDAAVRPPKPAAQAGKERRSEKTRRAKSKDSSKDGDGK